MEYYIFNPDTEMAMASGRKQYTPPAPVSRFAARLSLLPALYAPEGSVILSDSADRNGDLPYYDIARSRGISIKSIRNLGDHPVVPWGWNPALKTRLSAAGIPDDRLPADTLLETWRRLAHSSAAVRILGHFDYIREKGLIPRFFQDKEAVAGYMSSAYGAGRSLVAKLPWSSSGRGVFFNPDIRTVHNAMSRQRGVMLEPMWDNAFDFASEWESRGGRIHFLGFSVFQSDAYGRYAGNLVASASRLKALILRHCAERSLDSVVAKLRESLESEVAPHYQGPLGIDMLCDRAGMINPCVEMNLRMTMGHVALRVQELFGRPDGNPFLFSPGKENEEIHV